MLFIQMLSLSPPPAQPSRRPHSLCTTQTGSDVHLGTQDQKAHSDHMQKSTEANRVRSMLPRKAWGRELKSWAPWTAGFAPWERGQGRAGKGMLRVLVVPHSGGPGRHGGGGQAGAGEGARSRPGRRRREAVEGPGRKGRQGEGRAGRGRQDPAPCRRHLKAQARAGRGLWGQRQVWAR